MDVDFATGRWTTRSRRRGLAPLFAGLIAALAIAIAAPAQAHEPYGAKAWGLNTSGQLGDGTTAGPEECGPEKAACSTSPVGVSGLSGVSVVSGGPTIFNAFSLALLEDGTIRAWGENGFGQLGNGTKSSSAVPVAVSGLSGVTAISAGEAHGLALLSNGTVEAWGKNNAGQLGDGTTKSSNAPVAVSGLSEVVAIAAGGKHSLALLKNGMVMAWGSNDSGQLGDGTETTQSDVSVAVCAAGEKAPCVKDLSGVVAISGGYRHSLALLANGAVTAWGSNSAGELGNGKTGQSNVPVAVSGLSEVKAISAGEEHSLAVLSNGTVKAWGSNGKGQLGDETSTGPETCGTFFSACAKTPVAVSGLSGVIAVAAGGQHSLTLLKDGTVRAWGLNGYGQLGVGTSLGPEPCGPGACSTTPVEVHKLVDVKGIAAGGQHSLAFGPPPPSVTAISPNEVRKKGATSVTISGADFEEATAVKFGSNNATSFTVNSEGSISAIAPSGTGSVDVTVTTPAGTSATSPADRFYYERPTVKKLSPRKGPASGGTSVTITGAHFAGATAVKFGSNNAASFTVNSETSITAVSPAGTKGTVDVTVTTPNGTSAISKRDRFKYT